MSLPAHVADALATIINYIADTVASKASTTAPIERPSLNLVSRSSLAAMMDLSPHTIDRLVRAGRIPVVMVGDSKRFDPAAVRMTLDAETPAKIAEEPKSGPRWAARRPRRG